MAEFCYAKFPACPYCLQLSDSVLPFAPPLYRGRLLLISPYPKVFDAVPSKEIEICKMPSADKAKMTSTEAAFLRFQLTRTGRTKFTRCSHRNVIGSARRGFVSGGALLMEHDVPGNDA